VKDWACIGVFLLGVATVLGAVGHAAHSALTYDGCPVAHADYVAHQKSMAECTVANNCILTPEDLLRLNQSEARMLSACKPEGSE
jgi:hypothetical protein